MAVLCKKCHETPNFGIQDDTTRPKDAPVVQTCQTQRFHVEIIYDVFLTAKNDFLYGGKFTSNQREAFLIDKFS